MLSFYNLPGIAGKSTGLFRSREFRRDFGCKCSVYVKVQQKIKLFFYTSKLFFHYVTITSIFYITLNFINLTLHQANTKFLRSEENP